MNTFHRFHSTAPWLVAVFLLASWLPVTQAQSGQIVVMSSACSTPTGLSGASASVAFFAADGLEFSRRLLPGDRIPVTEKGIIRVPEGCRLKLLYEGKAFEPTAGRDFLFRDSLRNDSKVSRLSFTSRFLAFVSKSLEDSSDEKKMLTNYRQNMSLRAGIKGFGAQDYEIEVPLLTDGRVSTEFLTFHWSDGNNSDAFLFRLYRQRDKMDLLLKMIQDPRIQLDRGAVHLEPGEAYTWEVRTTSEPARRSEPITFVFDPEGANKVMDDLLPLPDYKEGSEEEKTIMYAFALEENQFYYDAAAIWEAALSTYPDNRFIRDMAAAFYARMNMLPHALGALR